MKRLGALLAVSILCQFSYAGDQPVDDLLGRSERLQTKLKEGVPAGNAIAEILDGIDRFPIIERWEDAPSLGSFLDGISACGRSIEGAKSEAELADGLRALLRMRERWCEGPGYVNQMMGVGMSRLISALSLEMIVRENRNSSELGKIVEENARISEASRSRLLSCVVSKAGNKGTGIVLEGKATNQVWVEIIQSCDSDPLVRAAVREEGLGKGLLRYWISGQGGNITMSIRESLERFTMHGIAYNAMRAELMEDCALLAVLLFPREEGKPFGQGEFQSALQQVAGRFPLRGYSPYDGTPLGLEVYSAVMMLCAKECKMSPVDEVVGMLGI